MKKFVLVAALSMFLQTVFAGGLLTNYNQSAQYVRMMSRNASLDIDAVFYNPAGLTKLENGFHFSLSSQTIWQGRDIESTFPLLNQSEYKGETFVPVYPDFYAVYKKDKWAFSFGFYPLGGGGTAEFKDGLPAFEIPIANTANLLALAYGYPITGYDVDLYFKGSSTFYGVQLGATYALNDKLSVYGGIRWVPCVNKYEGHIQGIQFNYGGTWVDGTNFSSELADKTVNTEQSGSGITPMIGFDYAPNEDWLFTAKYEMKTALTLDNKPKSDDNYSTTLWGDEVSSDIPALLAVGVGYFGIDWLEAQFSYNIYFDKGVDWGYNVNDNAVGTDPQKREIDGMDHEFALGLQFALNKSFAFSVGCLYSITGVADSYQNDLSYSNTSTTLSAGIEWKLNNRLTVDLGVMNSFYEDETIDFTCPSTYLTSTGSEIGSYSNTYGKTTFTLAAGISYSIFK